MRRLLLIGNDQAGTSDERAIDAVLAVLRSRDDVEVETVTTADLDDLREALAEAGDAELVVAGGDGSLHAVIAALDELGALGATESDGPLLGLIPLGTGNDFARAADIPVDPSQAAAIVLDGPVVPIDILRDDTGAVAVNAVHVGVGEEAGRLAKPWKEKLSAYRLGFLGYLVGGVTAGLGQRGRHLQVEADGEVVSDGEKRVLQVAVGIGTSVGGGTALTPDARPGDGQANLMVSFADSPLRRLRYALHLGVGDQYRLDDVTHRTATEVTVRGNNAPFGINADGEDGGKAESRTWTVEPGAYRLHVPDAPAVTGETPGPVDRGVS